MLKNNKNQFFWLYQNSNCIELYSQKNPNLNSKLICNCRNYQSALRIGKQIADVRNTPFEEIYLSLRFVKNLVFL